MMLAMFQGDTGGVTGSLVITELDTLTLYWYSSGLVAGVFEIVVIALGNVIITGSG